MNQETHTLRRETGGDTPRPDGALECRPGLEEPIMALLDYCRSRNWAGYDPYDALNSRVFACVPFFRNRFCRIAFTQAMKRSPLNLRPAMGIAPRQNPKGIALFLSARVRLHRAGLSTLDEVRDLARQLLALRSPDQAHDCWGYHFPWQTRGYLVPRWTPNIICSTFAANALLDAYEVDPDPGLLESAQGVCRFLTKDLLQNIDDRSACFSYTPVAPARIHNANLLGAALLARVHQLAPSESLRDAARAATTFSLDRQGADGSWNYGEGDKQRWIDSFHTAFNLSALERIRPCLDGDRCGDAIRRGYRYYLDHFFEEGRVPESYHSRTYPIDVHSAAQALITLTELGSLDPRSEEITAGVLDYSLKHLRAPEGWFYFQKHRFWTNRIPFMRWSQAWMLLGLVVAACRPGKTSQGG